MYYPSYCVFPEIQAEVVPICFSAVLSLPVSSFQLNLLGGVGLYFGSFTSNSEMEIIYPTRSWSHTPNNFDASKNSMGLHVGGGIDIPLPMNIFLTLDALYTSVNFKNIKSEAVLGGDTTLVYFVFPNNTDVYLDYSITSVDSSGFTFRTGVKFMF